MTGGVMSANHLTPVSVSKRVCTLRPGVVQILVSRRLFGTSLMFGVAGAAARLHVDAFVNLLGEDDHSYALSHKGVLWHRGRCATHAPTSHNTHHLRETVF